MREQPGHKAVPKYGLLQDKVVLITGASRGIGAAAARTFAAEGATIVLAARNADAIEKLAETIAERGGTALAVPADVADPTAVERLVQATLERYGRLNAAFNNAGGGPMPRPLAEIAVADFESALRVNVLGIFLCLKYEIAAMLDGGGGSIVNTSSTAGLRAVPGIAGYVASKHAILGLTKTAALDYAAMNIRVNAIAPGTILTERLQELDEARREQISGQIPMGRLGRPEEVAKAAAWLLSDEAAYITGTTFEIDGGRMAAGA
jgi:NAD(P)-dependent dehydrogenase (short-subunit alcohol dehydrogenase family)